MELNVAQLLSMTITLLVFIGVGLYAARKVKSAEDFSIGGRSSGIALVSGTITGTIIGGAATMGTAQLAYTVGLSAWWFTLGSGLGLIIMAIFYAQPLRKTGLDTIPQFLVLHYGKTAGPITSVASSLGIFFSIVASMLTSVNLLSAIFGVSAWLSVAITVLIVVCYVFFGGIYSTGLSGNLKLGLIYLTLFVAGIQAYLALGGWTGISQHFAPDPWLSLFGRGVWLDVENALSLVVGVLCTQTYMQAIYAASDSKTAVVGALIAAAITIPVGLPSVAIGLYMHEHFPHIPAINALPLYILNNMQPWLGGAALAALLMSSIGSVAGLALGVGTMISRDIFGEVWKLNEDKKLLWLNRSIVLMITIGAALLAFGNMQSLVLQWNFFSMALRGTGIFVPLTIAVFYPGKLMPVTAVWAMVTGVSAAMMWTMAFPGNNPLFIGLAASTAVVVWGLAYQYKKTV